jgi:membrane dipeptidase
MRARWLAAILGALLATSCASGPPTPERARAIHERLIVLDTHIDTPSNFGRPGWSFMDRHSLADGVQVDYPRMVEGGVDGGVFVVFTAQGPRDAAHLAAAKAAGDRRLEEIRRVLAAHPNELTLALTAADARAAARAGKRFFFISLENSYPIGLDLGRLAEFHARGVRMVGPIHFLNNDLGDSSTDPKGPEWGGLSPLGRGFVAEANRLGLVIDPSHASDLVLDQILALSTAPVILSHTGLKRSTTTPATSTTTAPGARGQGRLVIQINAFSAIMTDQPVSPARCGAEGVDRRFGPPGALSPERRAESWPPAASRPAVPAQAGHLDDVVRHIRTGSGRGIDHVGIARLRRRRRRRGLRRDLRLPRAHRPLLEAGLSESDVGRSWAATRSGDRTGSGPRGPGQEGGRMSAA